MTEGTHIRFDHVGTALSGKTHVWNVVSKDRGLTIGWVRWYEPWRGYVFSPMGQTDFEQVCLREIADFIERQTTAHRIVRAA